MFGSMHRVRRERRNRSNLTITYSYPISQAEIYYEMYMRELKRRRKLENRIKDARAYVDKSDILSAPAKKILRTFLKTY